MGKISSFTLVLLEYILILLIFKTFQFCLATMYFTDPATICTSGEKTDVLVFQEGSTYNEVDKLVHAPRTWNEAQNDNWVNQLYFLGMGHHVTPYEVSATILP